MTKTMCLRTHMRRQVNTPLHTPALRCMVRVGHGTRFQIYERGRVPGVQWMPDPSAGVTVPKPILVRAGRFCPAPSATHLADADILPVKTKNRNERYI